MEKLLLPRSALNAEEEAYQHIQRQIVQGAARPGSRLVPEIIAGEIGISRTPVRVALRRLASEGLVTIRTNRSAVVRRLNRREMLEVFQIRSVLEGLALRNAMENMGPAQLHRLDAMLDQLDGSVPAAVDQTSIHREFHEYLCGFCRQPRLQQQIADLHAVVEPYMRLWASEPGRVAVRMREAHQELIDAIRGGDPEHCEATMRKHVMATVSALAPFLPDDDERAE